VNQLSLDRRKWTEQISLVKREAQTKNRHLFKIQRPAWLDLIVLLLMSLAAPWIAALVHSACVFSSGIRFYNAELWRLLDARTFSDVFAWIGGFSMPGLITFLILLPFRKDRMLSWILWTCCALLWLGVLFEMEVAFH